MDIFYPIHQLAEQITYHWLNLPIGSHMGEIISYFLYDLTKISLLLVLINYLMAITRYYFPLEKVRDILSSRNWYGADYLLAALLGVVTPFCSCSSIPLFIGFLSAGIPLGVTFTFLISSPLVNESSIVLFPAIFGFNVTLIYNLVGIIISIGGGYLISRLKLEKFVDPAFFATKQQQRPTQATIQTPMKERLIYWWQDGMKITRQVFPYIVLGVSIGSLIHGFVPRAWIESALAAHHWWTVPLATFAGVPLYANSVSVIPIIQALIDKGVPLGTAMAFMTATVTLSIPEALMLKRVMQLPLLLIFFGITTIGIIIIGYLFNAIFA